MEIFKIVGVGLLTCFFAIVIKQIKPEFYIVVILAGSITILLMIIGKISNMFDYFLLIIKKTNIDTNLLIMVLKILGIGYLTEFASGICEDTGNASLADKIILAGKIIVFSMMLPVVAKLLESIIKILP